MLLRSFSLALLLGLATTAAPAVVCGGVPPTPPSDTDRLTPIDLRWYRAIKPADSEMRWQEIPWMQDLATAAAVAKKEKRPLFVWVAGDEPLERC
jgi:hypothetical protein